MGGSVSEASVQVPEPIRARTVRFGADRIVLLRHGRVEAIGSLGDLDRTHGHLFA